MEVEHRNIEWLQIQYELAISIGVSLELDTMLKSALGTFLRKLNCSSGSVFLVENKTTEVKLAYAIPHNVALNRSCQVIREMLDAQNSGEGEYSFLTELPICDGSRSDGFYHILELPGVGLLVLVNNSQLLDPIITKLVAPLLQKLASACQACLRSQELVETHRLVLLERNMLRSLLENTPIIIFALDIEGKFLISEGQGLQRLGRKAGDVVGESIYDFYRDKPDILSCVNTALGGQSCARTIQFDDVFFDAHYEPVVDESGEISGVVGIAHDITERRQAVETLSAVLDTVGEGIITVDFDGIIVMVNREVEQIWGYTSNELLSKNLEILMPEHYREAHRLGMKRYRQTEKPHVLGRRIELEGLRKNGEIFPMEIKITKTQTGHRQLFTAALRDITHQKELEQLRNNFVATVSHELRTPLASVLGWVETLMGERPGPLNSKQKEFLDIVWHSAQRQQRLIEELLTVSKIERNEFRVELAPVSPRQICEAAYQVVQPLADAKSIKINVDDEWSMEHTIVGDANRLGQVLTNLLGNAIKFSEVGSTISICSQRKEGNWYLEVRDQGIGIPAEELPHLFNRFQRATNASAAQIEGTGLGLYICKAIVEAHSGQIELQSTPGEGTTIWFSIPEA